MKKYILILFILLILPVTYTAVSIDKLNIASGVVPHHLLAEEIMDDFFSYISSQEKPETIAILSPDHFRSGILIKNNSFITITLDSDDKDFKNLKIDTFLLERLVKETEMTSKNSAVITEHGVTVLLPYIKKYLPGTKVLPILIPADITKEQVTHLVKTIDVNAPSHTIIIASVDFSHYLPLRIAEFHDVKSIRVLLNFEEENFKNIEVDCWQALYAARLFTKLRQKEAPHIIAHKNSTDFSKLDLEETTSYFSVVFGDEKNTPGKFTRPTSLSFHEEVKTILITGDIMLDRGVENLINQNSIYYPFQKISQFLRGVDIVFGNLEGPVVNNPPEFSANSLRFAFNPEVIEGASWSNFNLFSLANNHILDMEKDGLEKTKDWLRKYQINFVGNPLSGSSDNLDSSFSKDNITFLAFNQIFPFMVKEEEIIETVKLVKSLNPDKFLIVSLHWGEEYQLVSSSAQQKLAHQTIEAGADLIIGHHPHVVQNIEMYQGKLIFYSLGNFIFDQYFSLDAQQGLAVGLEIYSDRLICRLFPLQINLSQPSLMDQNKTREFLRKLAQRSDRKLVDEINNGIIKIER